MPAPRLSPARGRCREFRHPDPYGRCPVQQRSPRRPDASPLGIDGLGAGGGVGNLGTLTVTGCTFTDNQAVGGSGSSGSVHAGSGAGGGIANLAVANVTNSTFTGNLAQGGSNSSGNDSGGAGGGGHRQLCGVLTVAGSTFTDNQAQGGNDNSGSTFAGVAAGGAIDSLGTAATSLVVSQGTFTNNQAQGGSAIRAAPSPAAVSAAASAWAKACDDRRPSSHATRLWVAKGGRCQRRQRRAAAA